MKKLLTALLAAALLFSLTACGSGDKPPSGSEDNAPSSQKVEQPSNTPDPGEDAPDNEAEESANESQQGGEAAPPDESAPSGEAVTLTEFLECYGLSEDDYKPAHFIEFGKLNLEGTLGKASLGVVDIFVDKEKTTEEDNIAWYTHLFDKFQSASDTGKLYGDLRFAEELTGFDELIESNILWEQVPSFTYYFPYPMTDGRGVLMVNAAYDKENGKYSIVIHMMSYIR